jgi:hypothetical protein
MRVDFDNDFSLLLIFECSESPFDPIKLFNQVEMPENLQEREKYYLYSEMILQLQMARDHILRQQPEKAVSFFLEFFKCF